MANSSAGKTDEPTRSFGKAERDVVALGIAVAALILFVGTGGTVMPQIVRSWLGTGAAPDMLLTNAVLLNIALLIFGWRRYADLQNEVKERRKAEERARQLAETDPLTDCLNRRSGGPAIDALCARARASRCDVAVLLFDLDNFKQINDLNGHKMGDRVLVEVSRRVRELLPEDAILARIGGDEFVCAVMFEALQRGQIDQLAEDLIESVSRPVFDDGLRVEATVSIGIARRSEDSGAEEPFGGEELIHRADIAMYQAKRRGRNRYTWFETQMEDEMRFRNDLETGIRRGISRGEFVPYYEQQIDLASGELVGFEMLARWRSPQFGLVSPETFIPIAEEIDLISELSESLIRQALKDAREWDPRLTLSVNISPLQLRDPWFAQKLLRMLADSGFPPGRLEIEITESCLLEDINAVRTMVSSLKNQGIRISLDDFGTGYSSLTQLRSLPFDRLKIDRSFVAELASGGVSSSLVKAIISLGRGLALPVTAEGVESPDVLDALRKMGELKGQGYLYGKPEDATTTRERLAQMHLLVQGELAADAPAALTSGNSQQYKAG
ncbi:diguanylate cyclase (GGDEF)-like protein [Altererythrobacter atlanticus]|uniref:Phytochrome-like protein cph2 n=1 Tax=Croceibacterium atlanticum TaxID=1267766 RepID=A0A0F7KMR8_9SPHN|nr:EAL domain-containing protein [Croceibacterium atlanticum]AKH41863.1 Phytochrome-like protein cph2 [Croceibacterium atlanticum]MBB5733574.1 diguanylate cyclase (GGDEF)-like protein [Croceibacterium atlanticum]